MKLNGKTDIGCNRAENQDTYRSGEMPGAFWGVVCDGMGGAQNGRLASAVAADCIEEMLYQQLREEGPASPREILQDAINLANAEVFARSGSGEELMGTTVVCALVAGGVLHYAHVGDSRIYRYAGGVLRQLTRDHSMVQEMVDSGSITSAQALHHPEKNVITRALGVEDSVLPSFGEQALQSGDLVLLCSDGLSNMVPHEEMQELAESCQYWDLARELVNAALRAGGDDNITVLLMKAEDRDFAG